VVVRQRSGRGNENLGGLDHGTRNGGRGPGPEPSSDSLSHEAFVVSDRVVDADTAAIRLL
jgi:hypothetical protein